MRRFPKTPRALAAWVVALVLVTLTASSCHKETIPANVIVTVGTRQITLDGFNRYLARNPATDLASIPPEAASALLDQYVEEVMLSEYAASKGFDVPTERIAEAVRNDPGSTMIEKRDELRRNQLVADIREKIKPPSEEQIRARYDAHPKDYQIDETIHVRQILVHDRKTAEMILAQLHKGASFEELSARYSLAPNANHGGDIGFIDRGELPQIFEDPIFKLKAGEVSNIVEADSSFHIFKAEERLPAGRLPFKRVKPLIESQLKGKALNDALAATTAEARKTIPVSVLVKRLTFEYSGTFPTVRDE